MTTLHFRATPLTPIHIGTGDTIAPEDYLIQGDTLIRFNPHAVLHDMSPANRREYEKRLERNDFKPAQRLLQQCCKPDKHGMYRVQIGAGSQRALQDLINNPERRGEVHPLQRNPYTGAPIVPGSSMKGSIRTAIINSYTQQHLATVKQEVYAESNQNKRWERLEEAALNYERGKTESDPLRMLKVADADVPLDAVSVDQATLTKLGTRDQATKGIQMHFERLLSRADSDAPPSFSVEMAFEENQIQDSRVSSLLGRTLNWQSLFTACNVFYVNRMAAELMQFFKMDQQPEMRYGAHTIVKWTGEKLLIAKSIQERGFLLRLGRFSHFESLSVDGLREGWNVQKKKPIKGMGATRTLCETQKGNKIPFGWLLLTRDE